jgi:flagellar biosynthesis protein FlhA
VTTGAARTAHWVLPVAVVGFVAVMVIPLPPLLLDLLLTLDIGLSMVVLLSAVYVTSPSGFSAFPSTLLLLTVFRLGLNIATTRRILLHGPEGTSAAGHVIEAFGQFVVGGNIFVGLVIFLLLLAVQFVVINHGATRISEVAARFTLDAMPGKQMAIDADLNAGLINEAEARTRRKAIADEADFYGAMDGAVRFTQRDAVASLLIVAINLLAGFGIGLLQAGMSFREALVTYSVLTVGDGLVTAIPALLISVAGGLLTTRSDKGVDLGSELVSQLFSNAQPLTVAAGALGALAFVPGLPTLAFLTLGTALGGLAYAQHRRPVAAEESAAAAAKRPAAGDEPLEPLLVVDPLTIEVGYDLVDLAGAEGRGGLLERIRELRRQIAMDLGLVVPPVRVRDNLRLGADEYQILLRAGEVGRARLPRGRVLAIDPGDVREPVEGEKTLDPAFGIAALWVRDELADRARALGYSVVDRTSVLATHLSQIVRRHAPELLGRQETQGLLEALGRSAPKLVEELVPERFTVGQVQKVLQALLREGVSIRDLHSIAETMADCISKPFDVEAVVTRVRQALRRSLVGPFLEKGSLKVLTVSPEIEREILAGLEQGGETPGPPDPRIIRSLVQRIVQAVRDAPGGTQPAVLCSSAPVRAALRRATESVLPTVPFFAALEVPEGVKIQALGRIQ